jgi:ribosomal subunit interface protein
MKTEAINWNIVTKNLEEDPLLRKKLREKITKLEKHLKNVPPDAVHLHIALERHPRKKHSTAALTLRVPSNILHSEKYADDVITAFDLAFKTLLHELETWKSTLRWPRLWKRKERREQFLKAAGFAVEPLESGAGPQRFEEIVRDLFQRHYRELLRHARRDIRHDELAGDIPANVLDAREIVDEVARRAMTKAAERPKGVGWMVWFYHLIHQELKRQRHLLKDKQAKEVSTEAGTTLPEKSEQALQPLEQLVEKSLDPEVFRTEDIVPSSDAVPPDEMLAQKEALEQSQHEMQHWPRAEREVFELYYIEGLEPEEIAMVTRQPFKHVKETLGVLQQRLRHTSVEAAAA